MPQGSTGGEFLSVSLDGWEEAKANLDSLKIDLENPVVPAMQCSLFMQGEVLKAFDEGGLVEPWEPLSMMTKFIRRHRASAPNSDPHILADTGNLKNSIMPFIDEGGLVAGLSTVVEYAPLMQMGGTSSPNTVQIGPFTRRAPGGGSAMVQTSTWDYKSNTMSKPSKSSDSVDVKGYTMEMGGDYVPARPFFPRDTNDIQALGWDEKFVSIFSDWISGGRA